MFDIWYREFISNATAESYQFCLPELLYVIFWIKTRRFLNLSFCSPICSYRKFSVHKMKRINWKKEGKWRKRNGQVAEEAAASVVWKWMWSMEMSRLWSAWNISFAENIISDRGGFLWMASGRYCIWGFPKKICTR